VRANILFSVELPAAVEACQLFAELRGDGAEIGGPEQLF